MQVLKGRRNVVWELVFSHCGRWLAAGGYYCGGVHIWDTSNPSAKPLQPNKDEANTLAFRTDGRLFFRTSRWRWLLYDPDKDALAELGSPRTPNIAASPDAEHVILLHDETLLRVWTIPSEGKATLRLNDKCKEASITAAAFTADGASFATAEYRRREVGGSWSFERVIVVREMETGKSIRELSCPAQTMDQVAFSRDGNRILARWGGSLACWNLAESDKALRKATNPNRKHFRSMAIHPDGPVLTVDNDRLVRVWDVPSLATDRVIEWNIGKLHAVAVSPDGTRAAVGSHTGKVLVWDWD